MKRLKFGCKFPSKWLSFQSQSTRQLRPVPHQYRSQHDHAAENHAAYAARPHPGDDQGAVGMSFPRYPAYKDSGVEWLGKVPEHWEVKRLRHAATLNPSKQETAHLDRATEVSFLPMEAIGDDGSLC